MHQEEQGPVAQPGNMVIQEAAGQEGQEGNVILPVINPYGSNMELLEQIWAQVPMDVVHEEQDTPMGLESTSQKRKFGGDMVLQNARAKGIMESDEDDDHIILEMEERWDSEFHMGPIGSRLMMDHLGIGKTAKVSAREKELRPDEIPTSVEDDMMGSASSKRSRNGSEVVDKYPVGMLKISAECNGGDHCKGC
ncbi:hypothetical protein F2Q69_00061412 [Brassica cretica]|uniref:Uncharacterized protein n=1 Tax=Brassica cretica TaxID=69181 RepID=A0A8S9RGA2_BRACR|nr:hypothetical protein F2Q69_00061412 [Brassica cretica]